MKLLITNSVPLNGGDEALLMAVIEALRQKWPSSSATVLCRDLELCREHLPGLALASDLEFAASRDEWDEGVASYRGADVVISAPGGFLHDYYDIQDRLSGLEAALDFGKPVVLFAQSIGPFWKAESLARVPKVLNRLSKICVRDALSAKHLTGCGVDASKIVQTADAAFLWRKLAPEIFREKSGPVRDIGMCFRTWPLGDTTAVKDTMAKAAALCRHLLQDPSRTITFISTCQGIPGYTDDSEIALGILDRLGEEHRLRCRVNRARYKPRDLMQALGAFDAFIGMRLHACLLAMLGGTPAMGLGYESKTAEIFGQMGYAAYQTGFEMDLDAWLACANHFLADIAAVRAQLPAALDSLCERAQLNIEEVEEAYRESLHGRPRSLLAAEEAVLEAAKSISVPYFGAMAEEEWNDQVSAAMDEIAGVIPAKTPFLLVDDGQFGVPVFRARGASPFLERDGIYWGPPEDDAAAVRELGRAQTKGMRFAVFAWPAFWWLDHYKGLYRHLREQHACVYETARFVVFELGRAASQDANPSAAGPWSRA